MIVALLVVSSVYADSQSHWKALDKRFVESQIEWHQHSTLDWLSDSNSNWHSSELDTINKDNILYIDDDFVVVETSLNSILDDGTWSKPSEDDVILLSIGRDFLVSDGGYSIAFQLASTKGLTLSKTDALTYDDGTVDVIIDTIHGSLGVITMSDDIFDTAIVVENGD